jgi:hypothetical protein
VRSPLIPINGGGYLQDAFGFGEVNTELRAFMKAKPDGYSK